VALNAVDLSLYVMNHMANSTKPVEAGFPFSLIYQAFPA
jgi:hypothetical protein